MHKARGPADEHGHGEARRLAHVLPIGLANLIEMVG